MPLLARDLMRTDLVTAPASMPYRELQHLLVVAGIGGAPVVDAHGAVIGIVTATDLLRASDEVLDDDLDPGESEDAAARFDSLSAGDLATPDAVWVSPEMPIARVAQEMRKAGIHRVLVGDDGKLEGLLSAYDLLYVVS